MTEPPPINPGICMTRPNRSPRKALTNQSKRSYKRGWQRSIERNGDSKMANTATRFAAGNRFPTIASRPTLPRS